jgi:hypothetical protein
LTDRATPSASDPFPTTLLLLTDSLSTHKADQAALLSYGIKGKTTTKTEKAGLLFRTSDSRSSRELYDSWNPMTFNPPVHILKYDSRPRINRLVDARAIAKRVSILVHSDFIEEASRPTWYPFDFPVIKLSMTRIQSFASSERESSLYRVIYCFSSYREVPAAL